MLGLSRKSTEFDKQQIRTRIQRQIDGPGRMSGYRGMWHTLPREGCTVVPRQKVESLLKELDPEGCQTRRVYRLKRRNYVDVPMQSNYRDYFYFLNTFTSSRGLFSGIRMKFDPVGLVLWLFEIPIFAKFDVKFSRSHSCVVTS